MACFSTSADIFRLVGTPRFFETSPPAPFFLYCCISCRICLSLVPRFWAASFWVMRLSRALSIWLSLYSSLALIFIVHVIISTINLGHYHFALTFPACPGKGSPLPVIIQPCSPGPKLKLVPLPSPKKSFINHEVKH